MQNHSAPADSDLLLLILLLLTLTETEIEMNYKFNYVCTRMYVYVTSFVSLPELFNNVVSVRVARTAM
jgi:hypothetical protein